MENDRQHIALLSRPGCTGVELGVARGDLTRRFLDLGHFSEFHAVDKWNDQHSVQEYERVVEKLKDYEELTVWRAEVKQWLKTIPDGSFGFVYIDCYAHTGQDEGLILEAAWPKLAVGGLFSGDDYDKSAWPRTFERVNSFAESVGRHVSVYDDHLSNDMDQSGFDGSPSWYFSK